MGGGIPQGDRQGEPPGERPVETMGVGLATLGKICPRPPQTEKSIILNQIARKINTFCLVGSTVWIRRRYPRRSAPSKPVGVGPPWGKSALICSGQKNLIFRIQMHGKSALFDQGNPPGIPRGYPLWIARSKPWEWVCPPWGKSALVRPGRKSRRRVEVGSLLGSAVCAKRLNCIVML